MFDKNKILRKINRTKTQMQEEKYSNELAPEIYNFYGGETYGFGQGKLSIYEEIIFNIDNKIKFNIEKVKHKIERLKEQIQKYEVKEPQRTYNFHGGETYGRLKGKIFVLEEILDNLEEQEKLEQETNNEYNQQLKEDLEDYNKMIMSGLSI